MPGFGGAVHKTVELDAAMFTCEIQIAYRSAGRMGKGGLLAGFIAGITATGKGPGRPVPQGVTSIMRLGQAGKNRLQIVQHLHIRIEAFNQFKPGATAEKKGQSACGTGLERRTVPQTLKRQIGQDITVISLFTP